MFGLTGEFLSQINRLFTPEAPLEMPKRTKRALKLVRPRVMTEDERVLDAIARSREYLKTCQKEDGVLEGRVYDNITITSEYVFFLRFLGRLDAELKRKCGQEMINGQLPDGGWNIYGGGPSDHSATVEAYFALKMCGYAKRHPALKKAHDRILRCGGIETTRVFTKINLAMFGQYSWNRIPKISPELMLLPRRSPIHIYEFSSWSRAVIVPLLIIFHHKPVHELPVDEQVPELHLNTTKLSGRQRLEKLLKDRKWDLEKTFAVAQTVLGFYEKSPLKPLRKKALQMAEDWIWAHQDEKGNWGGIFPAMANSLTALHLRGYSLNDPRMAKGLAMLRSFAEETSSTFRMQSTVSPVWDTAIAGYAFQESGDAPTEKHVRKLVDWLIKLQILEVRGDWRFKVRPKTRPGGWPFEYENDHYPDIDDSALAILSLIPSEHLPSVGRKATQAVDRGLEWMLGMQGSDGGWGAFDRDNNRRILNEIPFADLKSLLDPSTPDVTGHVIEAFGRSGFGKEFAPTARGIEFLKKTQEKDGSWYGRWGVNYIYGTGAALSGLKECKVNMRQAFVERAIRFLERSQNKDGGWGESCASYDEGKYLPLGSSTASQTAWALIGLLSSPLSHPETIHKGVQFLLDRQNADGSWTEPEWTGTGFPRHFYLRYDYYRLYFPLLALGRFATWSHLKVRKASSSNA
jgi:squalene-hopene/tetraprenyl-beta-curcumene cyclase